MTDQGHRDVHVPNGGSDLILQRLQKSTAGLGRNRRHRAVYVCQQCNVEREPVDPGSRTTWWPTITLYCQKCVAPTTWRYVLEDEDTMPSQEEVERNVERDDEAGVRSHAEYARAPR